MVKVKICGLQTLEDIRVTQGADAQGFIVDTPKSPHNIQIKKAQKLVKRLLPFAHSVIVTTHTDPHRLEYLVGEIAPNALQIHYELGPDKIEDIKEIMPQNLKIYNLLSVTNDEESIIKRARKLADTSIDALLLDTKAGHKTGGTGEVHDWTISRAVRDQIHPFPVILAGGLNPENVAKAIKTVRPYGIDVATGVEDSGVKSIRKVDKLLKRVRSLEIE